MRKTRKKIKKGKLKQPLLAITLAQGRSSASEDRPKMHASWLQVPQTKSSRLWLIRGVVSAGIAAALAVVGQTANVLGIWGPPWPTEPVFSPGAPSAGSPFDVPFLVTNKSAFFPIKELSINCRLIFVETAHNNRIFNSAVAVHAANLIEPMQMRPYTCPFNRMINFENDQITAAQIEFRSEYKSPWPFLSKATATSEVFTWNPRTVPPHWAIGIPMQ